MNNPFYQHQEESDSQNVKVSSEECSLPFVEPGVRAESLLPDPGKEASKPAEAAVVPGFISQGEFQGDENVAPIDGVDDQKPLDDESRETFQDFNFNRRTMKRGLSQRSLVR